MRESIALTLKARRPGSGVKKSEVYYRCTLYEGGTVIAYPTWENLRNDLIRGAAFWYKRR